jgi:hypothetical protein
MRVWLKVDTRIHGAAAEGDKRVRNTLPECSHTHGPKPHKPRRSVHLSA